MLSVPGGGDGCDVGFVDNSVTAPVSGLASPVMDIGGYRTQRHLGAGAGGVVWQAIAPDGSTVALKVIDAPYEAALDAARREAALTAQVDHPHLLRVAAVVCDADQVALAMPLAAGGSLAELLTRRGRLRPAELLTVLIPIASALAAAHERGVVHGDLSPANIVFDSDGRPLLTDLGAARVALDCGIAVAAAPGYVAPEVAKGAVPDSAADVFALGAVALHCLSGRPAWNADDLRDVVVQATVGQWPDPEDADGPPALVAAVRSALLDVPSKRPGAASLVVDLSKLGPAEPVDLGVNGTGGADSAGDGDGPGHSTDERRAGGPVSVPAGRSAARERIRQVATRLRADGVRPQPVNQHTGHRRGPAVRRIDRRATVRIAGVVLGLALIGALAVQAGLIWAGTGQQGGSSAPPLAASSQDVGATSTPAASGPAVASSPGRSASGSPAGGSVRPRQAAVATSGATAGSATSGAITAGSANSGAAAAGSTADARAGWLAVAKELDRARARALVGRDPDLLDAVYTADAPARKADATTITRLVTEDLRVAGAAHQVVDVHLLQAGRTVRIEVIDLLPSYRLLNANGIAVGTTGARPRGTRILELVNTPAGYRIAAVTEK